MKTKNVLKNITASILALALTQSTLNATQNKPEQNQCKVSKELMASILLNEGHKKRKLGYMYIISFNNKGDAKRVRGVLEKYFIDSRTIDCRNKQTCQLLTEQLQKMGINNLDLGGFQINSNSHPHSIDTYFDFSKSYQVACGYVQKMIKKHGVNWYAIASYHSQTEEHNEPYKEKLISNLKKIQKITKN